MTICPRKEKKKKNPQGPIRKDNKNHWLQKGGAVTRIKKKQTIKEG